MIEALLLVFGVAAGSLVWWFSRHRRRLPPSPGIPLPFLGHLQMLGVSDPREVFASMRKKYGEIFSFYTGSRLVVVLNGYEAIHEALVKNSDVFSARPETFISRHMAHGQGILNTSGEHWQEQRRFTERAMRGIGINDTSAMEAKVLEEVSALMDKLDKTCDHTADQPLNLPELFLASISNVIVSIIYGHRFDLDDPAYCKALRALNNCFKNFGNMQPLNVFPMRYLPGDPCGFHECVDNMNTLESTLVYPSWTSTSKSCTTVSPMTWCRHTCWRWSGNEAPASLPLWTKKTWSRWLVTCWLEVQRRPALPCFGSCSTCFITHTFKNDATRRSSRTSARTRRPAWPNVWLCPTRRPPSWRCRDTLTSGPWACLMACHVTLSCVATTSLVTQWSSLTCTSCTMTQKCGGTRRCSGQNGSWMLKAA
ncbi:cytochrome P450 2B5-like isoform X1 [Pomacea canaliculata]|uniref:cytochrome P450 2B5-like isoform X1 n=1 Tax=Pomacea canaliculata TaxID=400727 RepID=UPI000D73F056|nr:cytochrome P450 2B5-like isoform X1 [Pomacea canaliculata]XP_025097619.1 cytochrome P450 2B5-like isoform X1 [Pomacea canaliculata]XP_025097620.1 cytochrome P450 2B5-like isoform X1 [Pomacea canaliculata]XP_025097621.1 cytochrome P450 2B5-like isoform X1 [Pomacea canaliculata]